MLAQHLRPVRGSDVKSERMFFTLFALVVVWATSAKLEMAMFEDCRVDIFSASLGALFLFGSYSLTVLLHADTSSLHSSQSHSIVSFELVMLVALIAMFVSVVVAQAAVVAAALTCRTPHL